MDDDISFLQSIRALWAKPINQLPTYIDLGRLAKRIDVFLDDNSVSTKAESTPGQGQGQAPANQREDSRAQDLANVIEVVATRLESEEVSSKVRSAIPKFVEDATDQLDYRTYVSELFQAFDEDVSPSVKVFKVVNQAALFIAIIHMKSMIQGCKTNLNSNALLTKDCRDADGWRIEIRIPSGDNNNKNDNKNNEISVAHIRKDQGLGHPFVPDYWDIRWQFVVYFTADMKTLKRSKVEVLSMTFGNKISSKMRYEMKRVYYESINQDYTYSDRVFAGETNTCPYFCCKIS